MWRARPDAADWMPSRWAQALQWTTARNGAWIPVQRIVCKSCLDCEMVDRAIMDWSLWFGDVSFPALLRPFPTGAEVA